MYNSKAAYCTNYGSPPMHPAPLSPPLLWPVYQSRFTSNPTVLRAVFGITTGSTHQHLGHRNSNYLYELLVRTSSGGTIGEAPLGSRGFCCSGAIVVPLLHHTTACSLRRRGGRLENVEDVMRLDHDLRTISE